MPVQAPQWADFLSCPICYNEFECIVRRPISLGCGHTMCKSCLSKLQRKQCPFDQTVSNTDISQLPENYALLQLVGGRVPDATNSAVPLISKDDFKYYVETKKCIEDLALYLKSTPLNTTNGISQTNPLSRSMQRKLISIINCQLVEEEGRTRCMRAARSLGDRSVTELILQHQNPMQLSSNLWTAVRARGCQFLGPAMQEEVLKLVLLALEDGSALSRKVLVMFVVQRLAPHFPQASKTSIGHVVQLLYRASCFKLSKCEGDSSLMQLKDDFRTYEFLRREHDTQIVQIATEAGLRIAPEQWSSLLYGDTAHKSHMQSIIDKLQTPQSFSQSVQELIIALQRTGDPGNLSILRPHLELLASIDPSPDAPPPLWKDLKNVLEAARVVVKGLVEFVENFGCRKLQDDRHCLNAKYKTSMCRDLTQRDNCPRGVNCTFAHSQEELEKYRSKKKRIAGSLSRMCSGSISPETASGKQKESLSRRSSSTDCINGHLPFERFKISKEYASVNHSDEGFNDISSCVSSTSSISENAFPRNEMLEKSAMCAKSLMDLHKPAEHSLLNPESPAFQPLSIKPHGLPLPSSSKILRDHNFACSQNYGSSFPSNLDLKRGTENEKPKCTIKIHNKCLSREISPTPDSAPSFSAKPMSCGTNAFLCKAYNQSVPYKAVLKKQSLDGETLAGLHQRKKQLLAQLDEGKCMKDCASHPENAVLSCFCAQAPISELDVVEESNSSSYYSTWLTNSIFSSPTNCTNSSYTSLNSSGSDFNSSNSTAELEVDITDISDSNSSIFCPSEKDEFIPFGPPLVSKYGPISRGSKGLIRGPAPIQVNAVSQMGELTSPTSVVCHPLPSASLAPTFYAATAPSFAVPVAIIPEQYLAVVEPSSRTVVVPVAVDCPVCPSKDSDIINIKNGQVGKTFQELENCIPDSLHNTRLPEHVQNEGFYAHDLKEELWEIEKAIQERESKISKDGVQYVEQPYRQHYDVPGSGTVPTSTGPWPSQSLENLPLKYSDNFLLSPNVVFED
ncbi:roquin-1-like [Uloborus diversus]|uniref:roquin-1-like n=1 Tax=Uloborus diversus TaxID=327109 RepID=UPI002409FA49|nr:roquin-1-like [Uloborus diversus]